MLNQLRKEFTIRNRCKLLEFTPSAIAIIEGSAMFRPSLPIGRKPMADTVLILVSRVRWSSALVLWARWL